MSDANPQDYEARSADLVEAEAANWLVQRRDWRNWSEEDQTKLDAWLAESLAHQVAFMRLEALLGRTERLRAIKPSIRRVGNVWSPLLFRVAVGLSLVAVIGFLTAKYLFGSEYALYQTAVGDREVLSLGDGSQIELNTDTILRLSREKGQRSALLDKGEAYFQIKHDTRHPFVVIAGENRITDLGTKFTIRRFPSRLEVTLLEGRARLDANQAGQSVSTAELNPGDVATVRVGHISVTKKNETLLADTLGWRRGILMFRYLTLAQAANELNRYNRTQIIISDPAVARLRIYGAFAANDVAAFADAAEAYFKLHVKHNDGLVTLLR